MPSISVQPAVGTVPTVLGVALLPNGAAAPLHAIANAAGTPITPALDTSAQALAGAVAALGVVLMPKPFIPPRGGSLLFGVLPI